MTLVCEIPKEEKQGRGNIGRGHGENVPKLQKDINLEI